MNERTRRKLTQELECLTNCIGLNEEKVKDAQELAEYWREQVVETRETVRQITEDLGRSP